ncbi:MAG: RNA polymerase sigma factor (sigma-70 family) [Planctomycetota bacterium]|jgi:RNA polymerase sigma factor (sigma-70 family)
MSVALAAAPAPSPAPQSPSYDWRGLEALVKPLQRYLSARCLCAHDVQDVLQETLMRAARYRHSGVDSERLRSWTLSIAANVLRDQGRRRLRRPTVGHEDLLFQQMPGRESEPGWSEKRQPVLVHERKVELDCMLEHLELAMTHLSDHDQLVLTSYYASGGSTRSAASALALNPGVIKVRLFRARQRLRRCIEASMAHRVAIRLRAVEQRIQACS